MSDQAAALRALMAERAPQPTPFAAAVPAFVVGSGKGGVGKSVLSALLAGALARLGLRTLLLDASQNQGNLHLLLGVRPAHGLEQLVTGDAEPEDLLVPVAPELWLVPADSGAESLYKLGSVDRARLHHRLSGLYDGFDAVVVDPGPGIEGVVRATMRASRLLVVATPEPAALSDAYALVKIVHLQAPAMDVDVIVNRVTSDAEAHSAYDRLRLAADRFLHRDLGFAGAIAEDAAISRRVRHPGTLLEALPAGITALAAKLAAATDPALE